MIGKFLKHGHRPSEMPPSAGSSVYVICVDNFHPMSHLKSGLEKLRSDLDDLSCWNQQHAASWQLYNFASLSNPRDTSTNARSARNSPDEVSGRAVSGVRVLWKTEFAGCCAANRICRGSGAEWRIILLCEPASGVPAGC